MAQLGAEAQVQVLGEGVGPPAASLVDGPPPPDAGRAVELEEVAARLAAGLLVPYLAWVGFAAVLNYSIWALNA